MRTCSEYRIDDCKTVNKVHYCYCHRPLCNGENAESIIEKLGDVTDDEDDGEVDDENRDSDEASGNEDNEDTFYSSTTRDIDWSEKSTRDGLTTLGNKFSVLTVPTAQPKTNKAVNFNLSKNILIFSLMLYLMNLCCERVN